MELVKIVIHSLFGSKKFDNVFCCKLGSGDLVPTTEATIYGVVYGNPAVADWNIWDYADSSYPADPALLQAIVSFMTGLRFEPIKITGATISDGQKDTDMFFPVSINQPGTRALPSGDIGQLAPGSIIWDLVKQPAQLGVNYGHIELRGALYDGEIVMSGMDLLDWTNSATATIADARMEAAIAASQIDDYFYLEPGGSPGFELAIPRAYPKDHLQEGSWYNAYPINTFLAGMPRSRQVHRGRKKSTP